jgi:hypothetical protein
MHSFIWRLLMWIAEMLDRNLITVPEADDQWPMAAGSAHGRDVERTRPILREMCAARTGERPGFVQG